MTEVQMGLALGPNGRMTYHQIPHQLAATIGQAGAICEPGAQITRIVVGGLAPERKLCSSRSIGPFVRIVTSPASRSACSSSSISSQCACLGTHEISSAPFLQGINAEPMHQ
jgi:hypothetical protein